MSSHGAEAQIEAKPDEAEAWPSSRVVRTRRGDAWRRPAPKPLFWISVVLIVLFVDDGDRSRGCSPTTTRVRPC